MKASERDELLRRILLWIRATADCSAAFYALDPLSGEWVEATLLEQRAARETVVFLMSLAVEHSSSTPNRALQGLPVSGSPTQERAYTD